MPRPGLNVFAPNVANTIWYSFIGAAKAHQENTAKNADATSSKLHYRKENNLMNKAEIINEIAKTLKTKKEAQAVLDSMVKNISLALKKNEGVTLTGFGTFKVVKRKARKGRNPQSGEPIRIKASKKVKFIPGKALKEAVE
jgi:nucleoid DNA-binding protein